MEAIALCERHLREKGLSAPAYCLMGMICQAAGDRGRAEDCFRKSGLSRSQRMTKRSWRWLCWPSSAVTRMRLPDSAAAPNEPPPCPGSE